MNDDLPRVYYPLSVLDKLREQRILDNDDLARAYDIGRDKERAAVVAWLLKRAKNSYAEGTVPGTIGYETRMVLEAIERGEHRREEGA
jgi:hypothetical protein